MSVLDRARSYLAALPPAVSGQGGHAALWTAALALVRGFNLEEDAALNLLRGDFNRRCSPPWSDRELLHKVSGAAGADTPAGYLLDAGHRPGPFRAPGPPVAPPPRQPDPLPVRLPAGDVARLWGAGWPVFTEARARRWFVARGLNPGRTASLDLARALPPGADCPPWARCGGRTWATGWPLLLPFFDAAADMVGLYGRRVATTWNDGRGEWVELRAKLKQVSPAGVSGACRATVYACPVARWLLRRGPAARPGDLVDGLTPATTWSGTVLVVEGGPSWLRYAAELPAVDGAGAPRARAVLGMQSGSWPADDNGRALAARIPDGARVVVAPDPDPNGRRYETKVLDTLRGRAVDLRLLPPEDTGGDHEAASA